MVEVALELKGLLERIEKAWTGAKTNKTTAGELLKYAKVVETTFRSGKYDSYGRMVKEAVQKTCTVVEEVTQRGKATGMWNAEEDKRRLEDCASQLNKALIFMNNELGTEMLRVFE
eukprot:1717490-Amphidinium_carterae.1